MPPRPSWRLGFRRRSSASSAAVSQDEARETSARAATRRSGSGFGGAGFFVNLREGQLPGGDFFTSGSKGRFDAAARALDEPPKVAVAMVAYPNTKNFAQPNEISESEREAGC